MRLHSYAQGLAGMRTCVVLGDSQVKGGQHAEGQRILDLVQDAACLCRALLGLCSMDNTCSVSISYKPWFSHPWYTCSTSFHTCSSSSCVLAHMS